MTKRRRARGRRECSLEQNWPSREAIGKLLVASFAFEVATSNNIFSNDKSCKIMSNLVMWRASLKARNPETNESNEKVTQK